MTATYDPIQQRNDALAAANETRLARAKMKREIKGGRRSVASVVLDTPWYAEKMYVLELLMAMPRYGQARARRLLHQADLPMAKYVGTLTDRQRLVLAKVLP